VAVKRGNTGWVLFAPSGDDPRFIGFAASRIDCAGWRPHGSFPHGVDLRGTYLKGCELAASGSNYATGRVTKWDHANLENFEGSQTDLTGASAIEIYAPGEFVACVILDANFTGADLSRASLMFTGINNTNFSGAMLRDAELLACALRDVDFSDADLTGVSRKHTIDLDDEDSKEEQSSGKDEDVQGVDPPA